MNIFDEEYKKLLKKTLSTGTKKMTRTGVSAYMVPGGYIEHNMKDGFPLTTLKKISFSHISSELECFLKGITDKNWLRERGNYFYEYWCNRNKIPYSQDPQIQQRMKEEVDLGPLNGFEWRHFGTPYVDHTTDYSDSGVDQIQRLIHTIKTDPDSKRMVVSAWNPIHTNTVCIPPCIFAFCISIIDGYLHLNMFQRSVDLLLGFPADIAEHALLLHLLAKETGYKEGKLIAHFANMEIYEPHISAVQELLNREPMVLGELETNNFTSIENWVYTDTQVKNHYAHPAVQVDIAI